MFTKLYPYRFEIFFFSQLAILFGSLVFPINQFEDLFFPILFLANITAGLLLISKKKKLMWVVTFLLIGSLVLLGKDMVKREQIDSYEYLRLGVYFVFYVLVTFEIINQIWRADHVNKNVIVGLMSGYISLGFIAYFMFLAIVMQHPESFYGLSDTNFVAKSDSLMYFSYVSLLTIGYGDIVPVTPLAQKAAVLTGLTGQFYMVIITAVVVGKFINKNFRKY